LLRQAASRIAHRRDKKSMSAACHHSSSECGARIHAWPLGCWPIRRPRRVDSLVTLMQDELFD
jgi:hypothetical protein